MAPVELAAGDLRRLETDNRVLVPSQTPKGLVIREGGLDSWGYLAGAVLGQLN